ncbi:MAG: cysteine desulfurase [Azospirillum brasilense]|nr:MAG: cysteine desulfurase [Azospirillum brasilense]
MIYLDYNATSPLLPDVKDAMLAVLGEPLNASSVHAGGRRAKKLLEDARRDIAHALGAFPNEVMFVASGSEANNLVLRGFPDRPLLVSAIEHASVAKTGKLLGAAVIPVDEHGVVQADALRSQLAALGKPALVSIMLANNETGVIQPIAELTDIVHAAGGLLHVDAVQGLGKISVDWGLLKADMLTISSHKVGGPVGAAALLLRADLPIRPLISGGGQELGRRSGTENIMAIAGFAAAVKANAPCPDATRQLMLRKALESQIRSIAPQARQFVFPVAQLPNTLMLCMPGVSSETQLMHFDLNGIAVSSGSACSSGRIEPSAVLVAMGVPIMEAQTAIRVSLGWGTQEDELHAFADAWKALYSKAAKA